MTIQITTKLRPFSHVPGAACLIPGTCSIIEAFPTLLRIDGYEVKLNLTGPVSEFTLQQDLERHCVFVFGKAKEGHFRLRIDASDAGLDVKVEKGKLEGTHIPADLSFVPNAPFEKLSLGSHKAQDWAQMDLKGTLPILFCLGQKIPRIPPQKLSGTARLLELPTERPLLAQALDSFLKAAFTKMLTPRLFDDQHQGLVPDEKVTGNPFFLIQEGTKMVRGLFFKQNDRRLALLPQLPVPFDAGRLLRLKAPGVGEIDLEWSKKRLRRVIVRASTSGEILLELQREIKMFRVGKGERKRVGEPLLLEKGRVYLLDRFEK